VKRGDSCIDKLGYIGSWNIFNDWTEGYYDVTNIQLKGKTLYEEGDILVDKDGDERMVLGSHKYLYHLSEPNNFEIWCMEFTPKELEEAGFTIKGQETVEETVEVSMDEIASKFGIDVKNLKIKKEN